MSMAVLHATANAAETLMTGTIKTRTMLIEEGKFMPESLQFESEPWTSFYMAGEIVRESRQASGKQNKYTSEGSMAHSDKVIAHHDNPCYVGGLPKDDTNRSTGLLGAPECGEVMKLQIEIDSETQVIEETEANTEWVKGKSSRKRWPSRTRISSASSTFPRATLLDGTRYFRIGRLHLLGSPIS
jgi:NifU-like N terminal domain